MLRTVVVVFMLTVGAWSQPYRYSEEIALWPKGCKVLADGIAAIGADREAAANPGVVITHPSYLAYLSRSCGVGVRGRWVQGGG